MSDKDYLDAVSRYLGNDDTLWAMIDGKVFVNFPETLIRSNLDDGYQTLISVSFAGRSARGSLGAYSSHLKEVDVTIQVDVASLYGENANYCEQVADRVEDLVYTDIDYTLNSVTYHVFVTDVNSLVYWDDELTCWHGVVSIKGNYVRTAT